MDDFLDVVKDSAAFLHGIDDRREIVIRQDHIGRFFGHIRAGYAHCDSDVGRLDGGRIVDSVTGHRVCLAYDVPEAVNKLRERSYHVVLADMKLPTDDGTEVLDCLPQANPQARCILVTGRRSEMEPLVQKALVSGANAVCYKPFDVELLLDTVARLCGDRCRACEKSTIESFVKSY